MSCKDCETRMTIEIELRDRIGQLLADNARLRDELSTAQQQLAEAKAGLIDIKAHMEIAMKGEHRMSTVWQIADMKLAAIEAASKQEVKA